MKNMVEDKTSEIINDPNKIQHQVQSFIKFEKASNTLSDSNSDCTCSDDAEVEKQDFQEAEADLSFSAREKLYDTSKARLESSKSSELKEALNDDSNNNVATEKKQNTPRNDDSPNFTSVSLESKEENYPKIFSPKKDHTNDENVNKITDDSSSPGENNNGETSDWRLKIPAKREEITQENILIIIQSLYNELQTIPEEKKRDWITEELTKYFQNIPESLMDIAVGHCFEGDSELDMNVKPEWLDEDKFRMGQKFARDYIFGINYADLISLFTAFSFEMGLKPLIYTNASNTPYTSFKRYLSTGRRVYHWYSSDPWTPGTEAYNDIRTVRKMHARVRKELNSITREELNEKCELKNPWCPALEVARRDFESTCAAPEPGQCPYMVLDKCPYSIIKKLSQGEMIATQFAFVGLIVLDRKFFGIHYASEEELEAFCHVWRGIGYLLGIEDRFNFCRGSLDDIRRRSRDFLDYWVKPNFRDVTPEWEHMMRCVIEGLQYYFPGATYETCLLDLAEMMNLHMPRLYNSLSYPMWLRHHMKKFYFNHLVKLTSVRESLNRHMLAAMEKANKYDEEKHKQLKDRSEKTLNNFKSENNRTLVRPKGIWALRFLSQIVFDH